MSEERRKILDMLAKGKISVDEAEKLLSVLSASEPGSNGGVNSGPSPEFKYLRVVVEPDPSDSDGERVNIRVPIKLIRAGLKLASLIPKGAQTKVNEAFREKGMEVDFSQISADDLQELVTHLGDLTVDVEGKEKVSVFCE
jgi:hypothetical protein